MGSAASSEITQQDIRGVRLYRGGIAVSASAFVLGTILVLATRSWQSASASEWIGQYGTFVHLSVWMLVAGTGLSVITIHLYIRQFHALLKILFGIGSVSLIVLLAAGAVSGQGFLRILYETPYGTLGFGFILATLCGIAVKEAFCFGMPEAVLFAVVTPVLVLGHLFHALSPQTALFLLCADTLLLSIFAVRKVTMAPHLDIGDKTIYS